MPYAPQEPTQMTIRCRYALIATATVVLLALGMAQSPPIQKSAKVKIEATELDRRMLLQKLNSHGADHGMKFEAADSEYDYRIVFSTGQEKSVAGVWGSGGSFNSSVAAADVFDGKGTELFKFERKQRGTDSGATNAVAKEIIKRLLKVGSLL
jgi:hypothetical protein